MSDNEENLNEQPDNSKKPDDGLNFEELYDKIDKIPIEEDRTEHLIEVGESIINDPSPVVKATKNFKPLYSDNIEKIYGQLINTSSNGVFVEPTCPICYSKYRHNIESMFNKQETKNFNELKAYLKEKDKLDVSIPVIENHIYNHSMKGVQELQKVEYISKIRRLNSTGLTTLDKIQLATDMIYERLIETASISADKSITPLEAHQLKNQDMMKLTKQLLELLKAQSDILGEQKDSGQVLSIETNMFIEAFNEAMKDTKTESERKLLKKLLETMHQANKG